MYCTALLKVAVNSVTSWPQVSAPEVGVVCDLLVCPAGPAVNE